MAKKDGSAKGTNKRMLALMLALLTVFALLLGGVLYYFLAVAPAKKEVVGGKREAAALQGTMRQLSDEEIKAELNKIIEEGMFRISIAATIVGVEDGKAELRIENNAANRYLMRVNLYLDDTGEEIYATDLIDPGYYIPSAELSKPLTAGEYAATAIFTALYPDTGEIVGTAGANVKLIIFPKGTTPTPSPTPTPTPSPTPSPTNTASPSAKP